MDKCIICRFIIHKCYYELLNNFYFSFSWFYAPVPLFHQSFLVPYVFFFYLFLFIIYLFLLNVDHLK